MEMPIPRPRTRAGRAALAGFAALTVGGAVGVPIALAAPKQVTIVKTSGDYDYYNTYAFKPATVSVIKGRRVNWSWHSDEKHNVKFGAKLNYKKSATTKNMDSFLVRFNTVGTYNYKCTVHGFTGKVVVKPPPS